MKRNQSKNHGSEEYNLRRERNNVAVKKSRDKARAKTKETEIKVQTLKEQNKLLMQKINRMEKELVIFKKALSSMDMNDVPQSYQDRFTNSLHAQERLLKQIYDVNPIPDGQNPTLM